MKISSLLCLSITVCLTCAAQPGEIGSGMAGLGNGISVRVVTKAEPPIKEAEALRLSSRYAVGAGVLHRYLVDAANHTYFGYDLNAEPLSGAKECRVAILPLTGVRIDAHDAAGGGSASASSGGGTATRMDASYRAVLLPRYPGAQVVTDGDTIALDLLTTPNGGQKLVDYIDISCKPSQAPESEAARDLSLDDAPMRISNPAVFINGTPVPSAAKAAEVSGSLTWFYFPGTGRFILSLTPRSSQGFVRAGTIKGNVISFRFGGGQYQVKSAVTIVATGQTWNLYVLHDPLFRPTSGLAFGSSTRLEQLISKH
jgi:hypothetical protein